MKRTAIGLAALVIFLFAIIPFVIAADKPAVEFFSPQGQVKGVRQVTVRFADQMVPFGDPRGLIEPFTIECAPSDAAKGGIKGQGRWADGKNWVYDFDKDLPAGFRCTFRLTSDLKNLAGKEIEGQREFSFTTGGPAVKRSIPYEGSDRLDEEQIFVLTLDAEADKDSIVKYAYFSVEGIQDHIGARIIEGKEREEIIKAQFRGQTPPPSVVLIQCKQRFPAKAKVSLVWGRGVRSTTNVATVQDSFEHLAPADPFRWPTGSESRA